MHESQLMTNSHTADVVLAIPSPDVLRSRKRRAQITMLCFSFVLISGLVFLL